MSDNEGVVDRLRRRYERLRIRRRRKKLLYAFAKVGRLKHDLGPGFSSLLFAYDRVESEGLATIERADDSAELDWHWPEDAPDVDGGDPA